MSTTRTRDLVADFHVAGNQLEELVARKAELSTTELAHVDTLIALLDEVFAVLEEF